MTRLFLTFPALLLASVSPSFPQAWFPQAAPASPPRSLATPSGVASSQQPLQQPLPVVRRASGGGPLRLPASRDASPVSSGSPQPQQQLAAAKS